MIGTNPKKFEDEQHLNALFDTCLRALLVTRIDGDGTSTAEKLVNNHSTIFSYLCFPLLEGLLRFSLNAYVDMSGFILREFTVVSGGRSKCYAQFKGGKKQQCSNLRDLLTLFLDVLDDPLTKRDVIELVEFADRSESNQDRLANGLSTIFEWRNGALHGSASLEVIGALMIAICLRIALMYTKDDYYARQVYRLQSLDYAPVRNANRQSPWSFYPP